MLAATHQVNCVGDMLHDVKAVMHDFRIREWNRLQCGSHVRRARVHRDRFHGADLSLRKLRKAGFCPRRSISFGDGFHRAAIQVREQCQVAQPNNYRFRDATKTKATYLPSSSFFSQ